MNKFIAIIALICHMTITAGTTQTEAPLRLAVAGVTHGHLGEVVGRLDRGDFNVVGVWEKDDKYRTNNGLTKHLPENLFYSDLGKMLDETKPEVVVAYGPIFDHLKVVEECAPRHIDVMVEKPLATTVKQAERIAELARKYGINVLTNYETSWYPTNHYAAQLVNSGAIGKIRRINIYDGHNGPFEIGCGKEFTDWLTDPVLNGGGAVIDFGCYGANIATWLLDGQVPEGVYAVLQHNKPERYPKVDDDATIILRYPGTTVNIGASWCWPESRKDMYIYGETGDVSQYTPHKLDYTAGGTKHRNVDVPKLSTPYNDSFLYLKGVVRGDIDVQPTDLASLENNLIVVRILEAAKRSAASGKEVKP